MSDLFIGERLDVSGCQHKHTHAHTSGVLYMGKKLKHFVGKGHTSKTNVKISHPQHLAHLHSSTNGKKNGTPGLGPNVCFTHGFLGSISQSVNLRIASRWHHWNQCTWRQPKKTLGHTLSALFSRCPRSLRCFRVFRLQLAKELSLCIGEFG